jgi:glycosyltransferase involved in cell wall biosynthesis
MHKVSVIVPCRNEIKYIENTISDIINQDYPCFEVLIIDGQSDDGTDKIIKKYSEHYPNIKYYENPDKTVAHALNIGIRNSSGEIINRMDVHCHYPKNYISELVRYLDEYKADNVGGVCVTKPADNSKTAIAIAEAISCIFGVGNSYFRLKNNEIKEVDTVPFGCYRRELFNKIGDFDTELVRNQDDEFNGRLRKFKGRIYLIPTVEIEYFARSSVRKLFKMYYQYGYYKPLVNKKLGMPATVRQFFPPLLLLNIISIPVFYFISRSIFSITLGVFGLYLALNIYFSFRIALFRKTLALFLLLPYIFLNIHLSYGLGYFNGLIRQLLFKNATTNNNTDLSR